MAEIYLTGAVSTTDDGRPDWDNPWQWHEDIEEDYPDHKFINPYYLNRFGFGDEEVYEHPEEVVEPALQKIEEVDGMLVRYNNNVAMPGTNMEILHAYRNNVPVVLWDVSENDRQPSPWLLFHTRYTDTERDQAMKCLLMYAGESAEDVVGFQIG